MDYVIFLKFAVEYFYDVFSTVNSAVNGHWVWFCSQNFPLFLYLRHYHELGGVRTYNFKCFMRHKMVCVNSDMFPW